ncbi:hypothetical protein CPHO_04365 [Corynebacterium phocae]|uniref:Low molecular weight antigen MTB12-like C-terminal domain-containing protein n=1 Tax=Corynebacterium phocae TaxID=161895 RepID=A0A1L7D2P3_9CORY|nr:hypothetical protein [Corynebacterium phocae]APT92252.1 hypothetical protein CPHO_04365 [Corynebacterium phocae]KAA8725394.1 hypothetical protein F4V58_03915 [Corynebacterium phocae]
MKAHQLRTFALLATAGIALSACSAESAEDSATTQGSQTTTAAAPAQDTATAPELPSAADLNAVLARAIDPHLPIEEKVASVQGGEQAPELFDLMASSQAESGATFEVVDPVLPGYTPDSVLATARMMIPEQPDQIAENVEFIYEGGSWKLSQSWACTLVSNTVAPEQVPPMCSAQATAQDPALAGEQVPEQPAPDAPPADAPAPEAPPAG